MPDFQYAVDLNKLHYSNGQVHDTEWLENYTMYFTTLVESNEYYHKLLKDFPKGHEISMSEIEMCPGCDPAISYGDEICLTIN